ncbi:Transcription termination factor, mitochondrial/chloroplastic [Dillenia turbinata]|uniref:Transcription termination factor, mitochondrial/chloroplastic n=1 Tax=Dillenia turbinata TaxID=194707 RepID=A0AAN8W8K0_9MAGN
MENYHVHCNFGVPCNKIGRILKETPEVFRYEYGVLSSKLEAYKDLGMKQSTIGIKDFMLVLEELKILGIDNHFFEGHHSDMTSYIWNQTFELLCLFGKMGCSKEELGSILKQHPGLLFEDSGSRTISLIGFLAKFSFKVDEMESLFMQFPNVQVGKFISNLWCCYQFLTEVEMEVDEIGKIVRLYPLLLGSSSLKKTNSILKSSKCGKDANMWNYKGESTRAGFWDQRSIHCQMPGEDLKSQMVKTKFLLELGLVENTEEMNTALKALAFRGRGGELWERFICLVNAGLPQILNQ